MHCKVAFLWIRLPCQDRQAGVANSIVLDYLVHFCFGCYDNSPSPSQPPDILTGLFFVVVVALGGGGGGGGCKDVCLMCLLMFFSFLEPLTYIMSGERYFCKHVSLSTHLYHVWGEVFL